MCLVPLPLHRSHSLLLCAVGFSLGLALELVSLRSELLCVCLCSYLRLMACTASLLRSLPPTISQSWACAIRRTWELYLWPCLELALYHDWEVFLTSGVGMSWKQCGLAPSRHCLSCLLGRAPHHLLWPPRTQGGRNSFWGTTQGPYHLGWQNLGGM